MTEKLYDISSKIKEFDATVIRYEKAGNGFFCYSD